MKSFFKYVLANIVAFVILVAIFIGGFIFFAIMGAFMDSSGSVKKNSILTLDLKTKIIESPSDEQFSIFDFKQEGKTITSLDLQKSIINAKTDNNIKGISLELDDFSAGNTQLESIRQALVDFKKSGKFVYAYGNNVSQAAYYIGSVADQFYLNPTGGIELKGLSAEVAFFKDFADKYGINIQVIRHGKFKAAVEPFMLNKISPENEEQLFTLLNDVWSRNSSQIAQSRKINPAEFKTITDSLYSFIPENNIKYKLADKLIQKSEYDNILRQKIGIKKEDKLSKISFPKYLGTIDPDSEDDKVAVLYASGEINSGKGTNGIYSETFIKEIKKVKEDKKVKAVVLRINSPGGSANASDEILFELEQLKKEKPLVVSFGDYAASGGYYIAMAADKIYSEPNTITGSIGVFGLMTYYKDIANKNGIRSDVVQTNSNSNMYSALQGPTSGTLNMMQKSVEGTYKRFVHFVMTNRKKSFEQIDAIGGGRVWSGTRAKELGLVDELGGINQAIADAAKRAKLSKYSLKTYPAKSNPFEEMFGSLDEEEISEKMLKSKLGESNYKIFQQLTDTKLQNGVMMRMPYILEVK
ncbi:signal peptide peptidase SppA [Soonwooa sp.]|uniref:signal peptide peptidase SppA n=1 Tax=Soonwooa sp. TaxID=1938592 RepID=UPI0035AF0FAE